MYIYMYVYTMEHRFSVVVHAQDLNAIYLFPMQVLGDVPQLPSSVIKTLASVPAPATSHVCTFTVYTVRYTCVYVLMRACNTFVCVSVHM